MLGPDRMMPEAGVAGWRLVRMRIEGESLGDALPQADVLMFPNRRPGGGSPSAARCSRARDPGQKPNPRENSA